MNNQLFQEQYQLAVTKAAIGVHVIETSGPRCGIDRATMDNNISVMCNMLAEQVGLTVTTVMTDVLEAHRNLPESYLRNHKVKRYIRELESVYNTQISHNPR